MKSKIDMKKVMNRVKNAQEKLQTFVKKQDWVEEARKYAERQSKEMRKLFAGDVTMLRDFLERERKELERFQKQIPGEVKKFRDFLQTQRQELEKILANVRTANGKTKKKRTGAKKKASTGAKKKAKPAASQSDSAES